MLCIFVGKDNLPSDKMNLIQIIDETYRAFEEQAIYYNTIGFDVGNVSRVRKKYQQHRNYLRDRFSK